MVFKPKSLFPTILFGVMEKSDNKLLSEQFLLKFGLKRYPTFIHNSVGYNFVYGLELLEEGEIINRQNIELVNIFIKEIKKLFSINFDLPKEHLCIFGNFSICKSIENYNFDDNTKYNDLNKYLLLLNKNLLNNKIIDDNDIYCNDSTSNSSDSSDDLDKLTDLEHLINKL